MTEGEKLLSWLENLTSGDPVKVFISHNSKKFSVDAVKGNSNGMVTFENSSEILRINSPIRSGRFLRNPKIRPL